MTHAHTNRPPRRLPENQERSEGKGGLFGLSVGETILSVLGFFTLLAAALVVPEVRKALHLETDAPPAPAAPAQKIEEPTTSEQAKDPEPEFKTVPLPEKSAPKPVIQQAMNGSPNPDRSPPFWYRRERRSRRKNCGCR